jgi:activator of HSP90 ATPase
MENITRETDLPVAPEVLCHDWLDSQAHSDFTGAVAEIDPKVSGEFTAWDGYISGTTIEIDPPRRILQHWRTSEFPAGSPDSLLEIRFIRTNEGTHLVLNHSNIPDGQGEGYDQGWEDYYFAPMREYYKKPGG